MTLILLLIPFFSGLLALIFRETPTIARSISVASFTLALLILFLLAQDPLAGVFLSEWQADWIPSWGMSFHLALDQSSWWLIFITLILGLIAALYDKNQKSENLAAISWLIFGSMGLFLAVDLFLFFVFWEISLLPVYWMLIMHNKNPAGTVRYIIATQLSGLLLLFAFIGLALSRSPAEGISFDYAVLSQASSNPSIDYFLCAAFILAALIKLPVFPFHSWLVGLFDALPVPILLLAALIKSAAFVLMRFGWLFFPELFTDFSVPVMTLGLFTLIYGAIMAFGHHEPKKILAYGMLSHMGLLVVGLFSGKLAALSGVLILMLVQALSTAGCLIIIDSSPAQGLWQQRPRAAVMLLIFLLAGFGFPPFGNFIGEWLLLWATFESYPLITLVATSGMVLAALYSLRLFKLIAWSESEPGLAKSQHQPQFALAFMITLLLVIGLYPRLMSDGAFQAFASFKRSAPIAEAFANSQVDRP